MSVISSGYHLADTHDFLHLNYYFNPEVEGFGGSPQTQWIHSPWNRTGVASDTKKSSYIKRRIAWTDEFHLKVKAGFKGKLTGSPQLKPTPTVTIPTAPKSSAVADRLKQLDDLFKQELISKQEHEQRRKAILDSL